jgi:hypothetical protein
MNELSLKHFIPDDILSNLEYNSDAILTLFDTSLSRVMELWDMESDMFDKMVKTENKSRGFLKTLFSKKSGEAKDFEKFLLDHRALLGVFLQ